MRQFSYDETMNFIHGRLRFGSKLGLDNITELMRRLGNPQDKLSFVHVAGTNGKGSTASYIANSCTADGKKTGLYISPFVRVFEERIQIDGKLIDPDSLAHCVSRVADVMGDDLEATEFEVVTAAALLYFYEQKCDIVVLEVGLGGRFDATNVIKPPKACVITSISYDHTEVLGDTIGKIAYEKCGIIKSGSKVVAYCENPRDANEVIERTARERGAEIVFADKSALKITEQNMFGSKFSYKGAEYEIPMLGVHQIYNALTAIEACTVLGLSENAVRAGLKNTRFCGRFETVGTEPTVIVDGAHNLAGAEALRHTVEKYVGKKVILVMGMLSDKEYEKCLRVLAPIAKKFVATQPQNPRKLEAEKLARLAEEFFEDKPASFENPSDALAFAKVSAQSDDVIIVCGSLYMIGNI